MGQREADEGEVPSITSSTKRTLGCVCMLNDWISGNDEICADNCIFFQFKLKGKGRSEKWEVYLYGDKTHQGGT